jgi:hypothetical protein
LYKWIHTNWSDSKYFPPVLTEPDKTEGQEEEVAKDESQLPDAPDASTGNASQLPDAPTTTTVEDASQPPDAPTTSTNETDLASQLPDAPTTDPEEPRDPEEPDAKKQKTIGTDKQYSHVEQLKVSSLHQKPTAE